MDKAETNDVSILLSRGMLDKEENELLENTIIECLNDYAENNIETPENWLTKTLHKNMPDKTEKEIQDEVKSICNQINETQSNLDSIQKYVSDGKSKESWLAGKLKDLAVFYGAEKVSNCAERVHQAVNEACSAMLNVVTNKDGSINQNPNLDGFIAEQQHVNTFNIRAAAVGSSLKARVLEAGEHGYGKNSVDIVVEDTAKLGHRVVKRYQVKYCRSPEETLKALHNGDYRGQSFLVPAEVVEELRNKGIKVTDKIEVDGISGEKLYKIEGKNLAEEIKNSDAAQNIINKQYDSLKFKEVAKEIGKNAGEAAIIGALIQGGQEAFSIHREYKKGVQVKESASRIVKAAIQGGANSGVKVAIAGALKVASLKLGLKLSGDVCGGIAFTCVEGIKNAYNVATGKMTPLEGLDKFAETAIAVTGGLVGKAVVGGALTALGNTIAGPVGAAIGGKVGSCLGYIAGEKVGKLCCEGAEKIARKAEPIVKTMFSKAKSTISNIANNIKHRKRLSFI